MTYTRASWLRKARGHYTGDQLWAAMEPMTPPEQAKNARQALDVVAYLSERMGLDEIVLTAIIWIETGAAGSGLPFRSQWWRDGFNLGNLGVTGDKAQNAASQRWATPKDGAYGLVAHYVAYAYAEQWRSVWDTEELGDPQGWDKRFGLVLDASKGGRAWTLGDLNRRWAVDADDDYGGKLAERANTIIAAISDPPVTTPSTPPEPVEGETPVATYNYDNGVPPDYEDYEVSDAIKFAGWIDPDDHFIAAVVLHSAYGGLVGSTGWFQDGHALTDYMVGNSFDGPKLDGELRRFNDPYGDRYAWASGPVSNPIDDAAKFLEIFGPNKEVVNMFTTAIERSCAAVVATNPVTEKEHAKRCAVIAYHANRYGKRVKARTGKDGFTCDTFPLIPGENNRSFLIYHGEINAGKRETCPDPFVRATIDRIIADVRTILAKWQKNADTIPPQVPPEQMPTYAPVKVIEGLQAYKDKDATPAFVTIGKNTFIFVSDRVRATKQTPRYQSANTKGDKIGPDIEKGLEFGVNWLFWNDKGEPWYITPYLTRVFANDTERIRDEA